MSETNSSNAGNGGSSNSNHAFVARFKHWRSGKIIEAKDYGYRGFPIGRKGKK